MRVTIAEDCIRCALCEDLVPDVFEFDAKADLIVVKCDPIPAEKEEEVKQMAADCAVQAIGVA
jgi:ferredoxin